MTQCEDDPQRSVASDQATLDPTQEPEAVAAPSSRSIVALLGGQPRPPPAGSDTAKRRRKNTDKPAGRTQGRIVLNAPGSTSWTVSTARQDDESTESLGRGAGAPGKGRARATARQGDGEEDEMREMSKRAKATKGRHSAGSGRKKSGRRKEQPEEDDSDDDYVGERKHLDHNPGPSVAVAPGRKRGRPKKADPQPSKSRRSTRSASTMRDISPEHAVIRSSSPNDVTFTGQSSQTKSNGNKQSPFSRVDTGSNSSLKGASQKHAIDVEAGHKPGPRKIAFASDAKPAHAFFSRLNQAPSSRATSVSSDRTAVEPVDPAPPMHEHNMPNPASAAAAQNTGMRMDANGKTDKSSGKLVHAFLQTNGANPKPGVLKNGWGGGVKEGQEWTAPWPGHAWPVHERNGFESNEAGPSKPRRQVSVRPVEDDQTFWQSVLAGAAEEAHPAGSRRRDSRRTRLTSENRETLCERFRPTRASQVLGNVTEATYLREWLSALSVGNNHDADGPRVMRRLPKRKPKLDDWIVDDIGPNGLPDWLEEWDGDEVPEPYEEPDMPLGQRPDFYAPLSMRLANSILLTGPSGCGKSAAVYAAATELGWEVFEVYPGIGKRTGGNLMSLVGDVGKNHMVGKGKEKEKETATNGVAGIKSFLASATEGHHDQPANDQGEPTEVDDDHPDRPVTPPPRLRNSSVHSTPFRDESKFRQSLILIEEVDILFEEESTFWPAVVALIAESRRPVVMTCNDPANCPFDSLPLQAVLHFEPPKRDEAIAYLSDICNQLGMNHESRGEYIPDLYDRSIVRHPALLNGPGPPNGHEWLPYFDFRRAIMQLQLERSGQDHKEVSKSSLTPDLQALARELDLQSYVDACVDRRAWAVMEINELDRYQPTVDDQLGVRALLKPEMADEIPALPAYDRTSDFVSSLVEPRASTDTVTSLLTDQIKHIRTLLPLLDPIIPLSSYLLPNPTLFIDYMPAIRTMIQIDDVRQAEYEAAKAAGEDVKNFKTGRPMRLTAWMGKEGFIRQLDLDEQALQVGRQELRYG